MTRLRVLVVTMLFTATLNAQQGALEFDPKVGAIGSKVIVKTALPPGADVRFGTRRVTAERDLTGRVSFTVPAGALTSYVEVMKDGKAIAKSTVPFIVSGSSVAPLKLVGLKEAIDVFGYSEARPGGGERPDPAARPILRLGDSDVLTIGETAPLRFGPAVELNDASSAATRGMGPSGFIITARPPKKKPTPVPNPD